MAVSTRRTRRTAPPPTPPAAPLPIGEEEQQIFSCPVCSRPLAVGTGRCPGCRTRLFLAVPGRKVAAFASIGLIIGLAAGGLAGATLASMSGNAGPNYTPGPTPTPTARPTSTVSTSTPGPVEPTIPPLAKSALGQAAALHLRLSRSATGLQAALRARELDVNEVARTLRTLAADAAFGSDLARTLTTWDDAAVLAVGLDAFYSSIRDTARAGLENSLTNTKAYRAAATEMLAVLESIGAIDAETRALAIEAHVQLPPELP